MIRNFEYLNINIARDHTFKATANLLAICGDLSNVFEHNCIKVAVDRQNVWFHNWKSIVWKCLFPYCGFAKFNAKWILLDSMDLPDIFYILLQVKFHFVIFQ